MLTLSKSKLLAYRQCPKRLWLEIHRKDLRLDTAATAATFRIGHPKRRSAFRCGRRQGGSGGP